MRILTRYVLSEFFKPLALIVGAFVGLFIIAQLVDDMRMFVAHGPSVMVVILYYLYRIPYYAIQVMPMAVLLSALFSLGQLARQNELIALRSSGVSFAQVARPLLAAALGIAALVFVFDEAVIPYSNPRADYIKNVNIERKTDEAYRYRREHVTRSAGGNRILYMRRLDALAGTIDGAVYFETGPALSVRRRLDAARAVWENGQWIFENGTVRDFDADGRVTAYAPFTRLGVNFQESPREFVGEEKEDTQLLSMSLSDLHRRIRVLKETGSSALKEEVNYQLKISFPFANFILALLGVSLPFIFPSGRRALVGAAIGFVITITTAFFYIGFLAIGTSLGNNGTLSPIVAVWIANVVFGGLGVFLMRRAQS